MGISIYTSQTALVLHAVMFNHHQVSSPEVPVRTSFGSSSKLGNIGKRSLRIFCLLFRPQTTGMTAAASFQRDDVKIPSLTRGWNLDAWLYLPTYAAPADKKAARPCPVIIMSVTFSYFSPCKCAR
jgi:hypothetical protein